MYRKRETGRKRVREREKESIYVTDYGMMWKNKYNGTNRCISFVVGHMHRIDKQYYYMIEKKEMYLKAKQLCVRECVRKKERAG